MCPGGSLFSESQGGCVNSPSDNDPATYPIRNQVLEPARGDSPLEVGQPGAQGRLQCPTDTVYDSRVGQCRREIFADPIRRAPLQPQVTTSCPEGFTYDPNRGQCFRETVVDPIQVNSPLEVRPSCQAGYTYDSARERCVREILVDPINNQPRCGAGYEYDESVRRCEPVGRYRRNGRVEMEDGINGAVIVDTWNERQWRWDRNPNGNRILPDVNNWMDRAQAYAQGRAANEDAQYVRGRPVQNARQ